MTSRASFKKPRMNSKGQGESFESKGTKPTREASSILEVLIVMILHLCKKVLFFDTNLKIALYLEEARAINGWERIKDYIRDEQHTRNTDDKSPSSNPLKNITEEEFSILKESYKKYTPYVHCTCN
ncbi:FIT family protein CG10671 [Eumeta japonica]|uniref:FIT family protein CG10671 n=1 Tax=Eumeta variegata TaxID=151549 RepID=A0A4C1U0E6_EUMVA|nr:FIT family protein CG10671 [Eumeta japonica]